MARFVREQGYPPESIDILTAQASGPAPSGFSAAVLPFLRAVISQTLLKTRDGNGRVAAHEILISTPAVRNLIRENKIAQINSTLQTGQTHGMQTLDQSLQALVRQGVISPDVARSKGQHVDSTFS